jgi:hypothetical protein
MHIFTGYLIFKWLIVRRLYKSFGVKRLNLLDIWVARKLEGVDSLSMYHRTNVGVTQTAVTCHQSVIDPR